MSKNNKTILTFTETNEVCRPKGQWEWQRRCDIRTQNNIAELRQGFNVANRERELEAHVMQPFEKWKTHFGSDKMNSNDQWFELIKSTSQWNEFKRLNRHLPFIRDKKSVREANSIIADTNQRSGCVGTKPSVAPLNTNSFRFLSFFSQFISHFLSLRIRTIWKWNWF